MVRVELSKVVAYPLMSEEAVNLIERENKVVFMVHIDAGKNDVKKAVEKLYEVKVDKVNLMITSKGTKKAFVKLKPEFKAADLAIKLGVL